MFAAMCRKSGWQRRMLAMAVVAAIFAVALLSSCFIIHGADHDCCGDACRVCAGIEQCRINFSRIGLGKVILVFVCIACGICFQWNSTIPSIIFFETPVSRKVRLND